MDFLHRRKRWTEEESGEDLQTLSVSDREVYIEKTHIPLFEFRRLHDRKHLLLNSQIDITKKWSMTKKSRVIESALINMPLPPIYLAEMRSGPMVVVDGQQRLMSFFEFIDNRFQLKGLNITSDLNGDRYYELDPSLRRKIEDYYLQVFVIRKETHPSLRFEIVRRIHEGAAKLESHEIRMLFLEEPVLQMLEEFSRNQNFRQTVYRKIPKRRIQETLLRYLAFTELGFVSYSGNLDLFLDLFVREISYNRESSRLSEIFQDTMAIMAKVFGDSPFFHPLLQRRPGANVILFELLAVVFTRFLDVIKSPPLHVRSCLEELLNNDQKFVNSILHQPLSVENVRYRYIRWLEEIQKCL